MQLKQVRLCTKIAIECMVINPEKRPAACHIVDRLDKMASIIETGTTSLSVEQQCLPKEQDCQEGIRNALPVEIKDVDKCQEKEDEWSIWGCQDTMQDASISSSNSNVFQKLSSLDIFNRKINRNFMRNGGRTIQQSNSVKIFGKEELSAILNIENLVGRGGYGEVYEGILGNRLVAIRKPIAGSLLQNKQFANEVIRRAQVIHKNILMFIGCCLEVDVPMLVYEFVSSGSLHDILHGKSKVSLNLGVRLHIAVQAADGLAYMHAKTNSNILFSGLGTENILLDGHFVPKISDFGISRVRDKQPEDYFGELPLMVPTSEYFIGRPSRNVYLISMEDDHLTQ